MNNNFSKHGPGDTLLYLLLSPILFVLDGITDAAISFGNRKREKEFLKKHPNRYPKR